MEGDARIGRRLRTAQHLQSGAADFGEEYGVTSSQFSVLAAIVNHPGSDQRSVSEVTSLDKSTVTDVLTRLVRRRLVSAVRSERDGRRDRLEASRAGVALVYEATPRIVERNDVLLTAVPSDVRGLFLEALETVGYPAPGESPIRYRIPSPDGVGSALDVPWGLGRLLRAAGQRYGRLWAGDVISTTLVQWLVLKTLAESAELDQQLLGVSVELDKATTSAVLARLSTRGLVSKHTTSSDRRRRFLRLTDDGRELVEMLAPRVRAIDEAFLRPLDRRGREAVVDGLAALERMGRDVR